MSVGVFHGDRLTLPYELGSILGPTTIRIKPGGSRPCSGKGLANDTWPSRDFKNASANTPTAVLSSHIGILNSWFATSAIPPNGLPPTPITEGNDANKRESLGVIGVGNATGQPAWRSTRKISFAKFHDSGSSLRYTISTLVGFTLPLRAARNLPLTMWRHASFALNSSKSCSASVCFRLASAVSLRSCSSSTSRVASIVLRKGAANLSATNSYPTPIATNNRAIAFPRSIQESQYFADSTSDMGDSRRWAFTCVPPCGNAVVREAES